MRARHISVAIAGVAASGALIGGLAAACTASNDNSGGGNTNTAESNGNNAGNVGNENDGCVIIGEGNCEFTEPAPVDPADPDEAIEQVIYRDTPPEGKVPGRSPSPTTTGKGSSSAVDPNETTTGSGSLTTRRLYGSTASSQRGVGGRCRHRLRGVSAPAGRSRAFIGA